MKNLKITLIALFAVAFSFNASAQDEDNKWVIGFGINSVDVSSAGLGDIETQLKDYIGLSDNNVLPVASKVSVARYLGSGFSVDAVGTLNNIDESPTGNPDDSSYFAVDFGARYDLNSLFGETAWFDPYVKMSLGTSWADEESTGLNISPAIGFNTWFNDVVGLNFESMYKTSTLIGNNNSSIIASGYHYQHSISLVIRFDN
ncbi:hypothetical protein ACXGQW_05600 [Wenyingzhuangia sp. IMCC45533]